MTKQQTVGTVKRRIGNDVIKGLIRVSVVRQGIAFFYGNSPFLLLKSFSKMIFCYKKIKLLYKDGRKGVIMFYKIQILEKGCETE